MVTKPDKYAHLAEYLCLGQAGDKLAYKNFLQALAPLLRRMVAKKLPSADVEDIVQEILISLHKARHTYDGLRPIMPWIVSIARFRITDHLRKHYAQMRHVTSDIADYENILADVTDDTFQSESIEQLLEDVPHRQRQILSMMHIEGYTAREVGKQLDMNESAVKVAAHRAIKKIREKFGT